MFDFVEIDSSFYRIPNAFMVKNWCNKTPNHFRFTAKFPKVILLLNQNGYKGLKLIKKQARQ